MHERLLKEQLQNRSEMCRNLAVKSLGFLNVSAAANVGRMGGARGCARLRVCVPILHRFENCGMPWPSRLD